MRIKIEYLLAFLAATLVAPVAAQDETPANLQPNPLPFEVFEGEEEGESVLGEEDSEVDTEATTESNIQIIERQPDNTADETLEPDTKTSEVAIVTSGDPEASRPPSNPVPGMIDASAADLEQAPDTQQNPAESTRDASELLDPNAPIELIQERYESGSTKIEREMTLDREGNYVKHGKWVMYSESGEEIANGRFVANEREGGWKKTVNWGESPILNSLPYPEFEAPFTSTANFAAGKLDGTWTITDAKGRKASEWRYRQGKLHGKAKWHYPDGRIREEIDYDNGSIHGKWTIVDKDGQELESTTYQNGRKLAIKRDTYEGGALKWEGMFLHETFVANTTDDWWNSRPVTYQAVGEPERHGEFTSWYENGQKKFSGAFNHEVRTGEFTWWHPNTQTAVKGVFREGEREGLWVWWHENGQKAIQGTYKDGKLEGPWSYWNADGKLERKIDYNEDNQPVAVHSVPSTRVARQLVKTIDPDQPVGTGVRMATRLPVKPRRNPVR